MLNEWKCAFILRASPDVVKCGRRPDLPGIDTDTGPTGSQEKAAGGPADCRQDMGGIGPLDALRFEPASVWQVARKVSRKRWPASWARDAFTSESKRFGMPIPRPSSLRASLQTGVDQEGKHRGILCAGSTRIGKVHLGSVGKRRHGGQLFLSRRVDDFFILSSAHF